MTVGRHGAGAAKNLLPDPQVEGGKRWWGRVGTRLARVFETPNPTSSDTPLPKRQYLLILVKVAHQLGIKHSNGLWGHSHFRSLCSDHGVFPETFLT